MDNLSRTIAWREQVAEGEIIESKNYTKAYLGFENISQNELDAICDVLNEWWRRTNRDWRIYNHMGEIIPYSSTKE